MDENNKQYDILLILILLRLNRSRRPTILPSTDYCPLPEWIMAVQIGAGLFKKIPARKIFLGGRCETKSRKKEGVILVPRLDYVFSIWTAIIHSGRGQ